MANLWIQRQGGLLRMWPPEASALRESELPRLMSWTPEDLLELRKVNPAYEDAEKRNQMLDRKDKEERRKL
ncbi:hypothetical protein E4U16_004567 [Claviceps sp. LM84 group G4]|nr:hypothetical protein E4U16_004567 [Claviceps sp. LM84 group G4]